MHKTITAAGLAALAGLALTACSKPAEQPAADATPAPAASSATPPADAAATPATPTDTAPPPAASADTAMAPPPGRGDPTRQVATPSPKKQ